MGVDFKAAEFTSWTALIDPFVFNVDDPYFNVMVPTADTTRYSNSVRSFILFDSFLQICTMKCKNASSLFSHQMQDLCSFNPVN